MTCDQQKTPVVLSQVWEFGEENCPNGSIAKVTNNHTTLIILEPVYPINTNSLNLVLIIFEELSLCHFPPLNTSNLDEDSNLVDLSFGYLSFSNKRKTILLLPSLLKFLQWAMAQSCLYNERSKRSRECLLTKIQWLISWKRVHLRQQAWGDGDGISVSLETCPWIRAQVSFSLLHHQGCNQSLPWGRTQK